MSVPASGGEPGKVGVRGAAPPGRAGGWLAARNCPRGGDGRAAAVPLSYPG